MKRIGARLGGIVDEFERNESDCDRQFSFPQPMEVPRVAAQCVTLALLCQACSGFVHSENAPYSYAYFPPGYLISPNPPIPAPGGICRDIGAIPASPIDFSQQSNVEVIPSKGNLARGFDRLPYDQCALEYANKARTEYLRAGRIYSSVPGTLAGVLIPIGGAATALGIEGSIGSGGYRSGSRRCVFARYGELLPT
jgi:hypothetical protein